MRRHFPFPPVTPRRPFPYNEPANTARGAPMGRASINEDDPRTGNKLTLRRVPLDGGGYDGGGAYWGLGDTLWCAWNRERSVVLYVRASQPRRDMVLAMIKAERPHDIID